MASLCVCCRKVCIVFSTSHAHMGCLCVLVWKSVWFLVSVRKRWFKQTVTAACAADIFTWCVPLQRGFAKPKKLVGTTRSVERIDWSKGINEHSLGFDNADVLSWPVR